MKNYSIWQDFKTKIKCSKINKDLETDVLIVGGGITGISILNELKENNISTLLIEQNKCGYGVTSRSTAKITYLQEKIYMNIRKYNLDKANLYLKSQIEAVNKIKNNILNNNIECDFKQADSYLVTVNKNKVKDIKEEYEFLKKNNVNAEIISDKQIKMGIKVSDTYVFHPLKYIEFFKNKYQDIIYENSKLNSFKKENDYYICHVNNHTIKSKYLVIAAHYPYFLIPFLTPFKSHIETSFMGAKKVNMYVNQSLINIDKPTISYRFHEDKNSYFIYLENSLKSANIKNIKDYFDILKKRDNFQYIWSNKDIITNDYLPWIGSISNNLLIATGFNTWGITNSALASMVIRDIILNKDNPYKELVNPKRSINLSKIKRLPIDISCSAIAYLKSTINNVNNTHIKYEKINNNKVAHVNYKNKDILVKHKCPHMKCGLVFNEVENTWDCLCHGSKFDITGKLLEGPSKENINVNKY